MALKPFQSMKAQMMSILVLLMFLLMLATLFTFAMLNVSNNNIEQALSLASGTSGYSSLLKLSANNFAEASAAKALQVLANYELTPSMRKDNFITNASLYLSQLMENGTVPNETQSAAANTISEMGNLTFEGYNSIIAKTLGFSVSGLSINETAPRVFQTNPYSIDVSYLENVEFTAYYSKYKYDIPVNISLKLNGTADLTYAQLGTLSDMHFASLDNITSVLANAHALTGNYIGIAYGTVLSLPSNAISGASCPSSTPLPESDIIIATYNAIGLEACMNSYAGLVSYIAPTSTPTVPYLIYGPSTNILQQLPTGRKVLIYGPELAVMDIENLRNAVSNGYYFASPFTPSYLDRASWSLTKSSPNGIFNFFNYNTRVALFNGASSYIQVPDVHLLNLSTLTIAGWVDYKGPASGSWNWLVAKQNAWGVGVCGTSLAVCFYNWASGTNYVSSTTVSPNHWYFLVATIGGGTETVYLNGLNVLSNSLAVSNQGVGVQIGYGNAGGQFLNGSASNIQIYNTTLSPSQIQQLYQSGISGRPLANAGLVGWWPLNGNANDYSGFGDNGTPFSIAYASPANYTRDSIFVTTTPKTQPLPGIGSCTSNASCYSSTMANLFVSSLPLENKQQSVAYLNGRNYILVPAAPSIEPANQITITGWVEPQGTFVERGYPTMVSDTNGGYTIQTCSGSEYSGESLTFWLGNNGNGNTCGIAGDSLNFGTWYMFAVTYNGVEATEYIDGSPVYSQAFSTTMASGNPLGIGIYSNAVLGEGMWNGSIANIQIYNTSLTAGEILSLYDEGIGGAPIAGAGLAAWYPLNGNANDYSGNGNNGTATNVVYYPINGTYTAPGLSSLNGIEDELESLGFVG
ncbi:MAG: LamG domain-containing protein [Candidatus Micrarchaeaceae archaeon]